jgi:hypothetical protein
MQNKVIVSLTTIPPRLENIHFTIESILSQTVLPDFIIVNLPLQYNNYSNDYIVPSSLLHDRIIINNCPDYGPSTKLLGLNHCETYKTMSDEDIIIVIDDDRNYNNRLIETFLSYHNEYPNKILTGTGWDISEISNNEIFHENVKNPRGRWLHEDGYVNILGGCCGFLLMKCQCPFNYKEIFQLTPQDLKYYVDDVWLSGFLTLNNEDIYMIKNYTLQDEPRNPNDSISALCDANRTHKNIACIKFFIEKYNIWN